MKTLNEFTKEELIKVIANISDQFQTAHDWTGYGFSKEDGQVFEYIGNLCKQKCIKENDWNLPKINKDES